MMRKFIVSSVMTRRVSELSMKMGENRTGGSEMRSSRFGTTKSVFQADPGASSRAECHHGLAREYE